MIISEEEKREMCIIAFVKLIEANLTLYNLTCHRDFQVTMLDVIAHLEKEYNKSKDKLPY